MRVTRLEVQDILGVRKLDVYLPPTEPVHLFGGPNGGGKSSALTALLMAMVDAGGHPSEALRRGASKGAVRVTFDDGMTVTRKLRRSKAMQLEVKDGAGEPMGVGAGGPQRGVLDKLYSKFTWDPTAALQLPKAELRQQLMHLAGIDWSGIDDEGARVYSGRTKANQQISQLEAELKALPPYDPTAPEKPPSTVELIAELEKAQEHNRRGRELLDDLNDARQQTRERSRRIKGLGEQIKLLEQQLATERNRLKEDREAEQTAQLAAENHAAIDEEAIRARLAGSQAVSEAVAANAARKEKEKELEVQRLASRHATARLKEIDAEKQEQLESASFPVDGLSVSDEGVLYNGLPFEQAEESARLRVAVAIGMRLNPQLPTMICRYGGGLDEQSIELLKQIVAELGGQLLLEHPWVPPEKCTAYIREGRSVDPEQLKLT